MEAEKGNLTNYKTILKAGRISSLAVVILYIGYFLYTLWLYYNWDISSMSEGETRYLPMSINILWLIITFFVLVFAYQMYTFYQYLGYQEIKKYIKIYAKGLLLCSIAFIILLIIIKWSDITHPLLNYENICIGMFAFLLIISFSMGCSLIKDKDNITKEFSSLGYAMCISSVLFPLWFIVVPIFLYNIFSKEKKNMTVAESK